MRKVFVLMAMLVLALLCSGERAQADSRDIDRSSPQEIVDGMANKLVRGVANISTGWVELPKQIYLTSKDEGAVKGITVGPIKGIGMTLVRTVVGVAEVGTFFLAYPGFYSPYFDPAFVWQKE